MRHLLATIILALIVIPSQATNIGGYKITGEIDGLEGEVYLVVMEGKVPNVIDTTEVTSGIFTFTGSVDLPIYARIDDDLNNTLLYFFLENSEIKITGTNSYKNVIGVSGSKENEIYHKIKTELASAQSMEEGNALIFEYPESVAAAYIFYRERVPYMTAEEMREGVARFSPALHSSVYLQQVSERAVILEKTAVGTKFIDFELPDPSGNMIKLSDIAGRGDKYVLLDFWASWCPPCRAENPHVVASFNKYKDKGFTVFGVSLDKDRNGWIEAIESDELNWTNVSDLKFWEGEVVHIYGIGSIPSNVLIAPDGTIIAKNLRGSALDEKLAEIFGEQGEVEQVELICL